MAVAGIVAEYNPFHSGHAYQITQTRRRLGEGTGIVCVMSGNWVQRGECALTDKWTRAALALRGGADLVLELPLPWAAAPAERFADGGVQVLLGTGVVDALAFGSECGDGAALRRLAAALLSAEFPSLLKEELARGDSFAAARQRAAGQLTSPGEAALLSQPNNTLGVEYCKALLARNAPLEVLTIPRRGAPHDAETTAPEQSASAAAIRALLRQGRRQEALRHMAPAMAEVYRDEEAAGRAPVFLEKCERAVLARLRTMEEADFAALDQGREGLYRRLYRASRAAVSVEDLLAAAKTKRYPHARLRRMVLWAYLGLRPGDFPDAVPYLRVLAANARGQTLLARMRKTASVPILTKPAAVNRLGAEARELFAMEARAADLYALAYPNLSAAVGGSLWREGPVMI